MTDPSRTNQKLIDENALLKQRIQELEHSESERKRAEEALRQSEGKYRTLIENIKDGIYILDSFGHFTFVNEVIVKRSGFPAEWFLGRSYLDVIIEEDRERVQRHFNAVMDGKPQLYDLSYPSESGNLLRVEVSTAPLFDGAKVIGLLGVSRDITDRKRMEEELLKADKLESVGILAGGIAHDFNNILTSISGNISMAKMHLKSGSKGFDLLSSAETASMRAMGMTGQLLTFARGGTPVKATASISRLIEESSLFVLQGTKSGCEFSIAENLWPVLADTGQISQAISNIVINANQAMPEGGIVQVAAENLVLEESQGLPLNPGRYIRISIKDQGVGIAKKHLSKIFDPYFTTKNEGSGLGLAAVYSIIKKHSGHISVNSSLGAGTTFDIYLPASGKDIPVTEKFDLITGAGKILVMDDDRLLREMAVDMLEMLGYEAEFAEDGAEAIEMYRKAKESEKPYDAVILDLTIQGGMGGKEAAKRLLEIDPELKAIVFSGYSDSPVMSNYRKYGFKGMMAKPFDFKTLGKVLNDVLKKPKIEDRTSNIES